MIDVAISSVNLGAASSRPVFGSGYSRASGMDRRLPTRRVAAPQFASSAPSISRIIPRQQVEATSGDHLTHDGSRQHRVAASTTAPTNAALLDYWATSSSSSPQATPSQIHQQYPQFHQQQEQVYSDSAAEVWQAQQVSNRAHVPFQQASPLATRPVIQITHSPAAVFRPQEPRFDNFRALQQDLLTPYTMAYEPQQVSDVPLQHVPVSPVSHHSRGPSRGASPIGEQTRKRSFSQLEQGLDHNPSGLSAVTSPNGLYMDDGRSGRVIRTIKRPDAPMNDQNKYICDVTPDCASLTFERKCEWSKHMDKHDRPYRCPHPSCAKLQGFTYSGGLLRHEREVHNKHGGPRAFLMCPHTDCKRHTEKGFTRRENLQEHLRRVHAGRGDPQTDIAPAIDGAMNTELDTPASALSAENQEELYAALQKRGDDRPIDELDDLRIQLQRLRAENEAKSAVIQRLEDDARIQKDRLVSLEQTLHSMQQQIV